MAGATWRAGCVWPAPARARRRAEEVQRRAQCSGGRTHEHAHARTRACIDRAPPPPTPLSQQGKYLKSNQPVTTRLAMLQLCCRRQRRTTRPPGAAARAAAWRRAEGWPARPCARACQCTQLHPWATAPAPLCVLLFPLPGPCCLFALSKHQPCLAHLSLYAALCVAPPGHNAVVASALGPRPLHPRCG